MDDSAAAWLCEGFDVGLLAGVGVDTVTGVDDVALQLTIARPRTTPAITGDTSGSLPALCGAI